MEKILTDEEINIRAQAGFDELISLIAKNTDEAFLNDFLRENFSSSFGFTSTNG